VATEIRKGLLTVKQVAEYLHYHEQTVYTKMKTEEIPGHLWFRIGRSIRFDFEALRAWHRQDIQPEIINYQAPINVVHDNGKISKREELKKMRKAVSSKPMKGRLNTEEGTIFTRVTKQGVVRYYAQYYDKDRKLNEKVLRHAKNLNEAKVALSDIYDEQFRRKYNITPKKRTATLGEFVVEHVTDQRLRGHMLDFFGGKWLDEITELEVLAYVRKREQAGAKNNTINNELIALRKTLYLAKRGRYEIDDQIKWGNCQKRQEFRDRVLSTEEEERLMLELAQHLRPIVVCALNSGMRKGEILSLKWKNIVDGKIVLEAQNTKTKKQRCIPINSKLQQVIDILRSRDGFSDFVFTYGGKKMRDVQNGFSKACKRAKIDGLCFHDLRRTFATRLMRNGIGIYTISQLLGHADVKMTQRYINWQPEDGAEAVESLVKNTPEKRNILGIEKNEQFRIPLVTSVGIQ